MIKQKTQPRRNRTSTVCRGTTYLRRRKAASHPRNVRHTAPLLIAGRRAPALFGLLLRSVIPPTRAARLSPARALLEPSFEVLLSLMAFICPHCSRISPACQEFCPGSRLSYGKRRKSDKPSAAAHDRPPVFSLHPAFPTADRSPAPYFLSPRLFPAPPLDSAPRRPSPVEPPTLFSS